MTTPKLRFKEFSEDWGSKKIIELADYVDYRGKTPKKVESGVLLVTAKNIKQGYLDYSASQEFIEESAFDDVMRRGKVELNDVLITTEAPLGNVASVDRTDIALAQRVIKYRGKIGLLDNLFLKQKFLSESFQEILKSKATGGTVQGIKGSVLHQIPLIVPSKEEQTKIAAFLSAVDEKISQLSQKHVLLSQYKQGMMQKMFSQQIRFKADDGSEFGEWEEKKLSEICIKIKDGTHFSPKTFEVGDYKYLTSKNVKNGYLDFSKLEYVNKEEHLKIYSSCDVQFGDVLLTKDGTIGQCCVNTLREEFSLLSSVAFLRLQPEYYNYFLYHLFVSDFGQKEINGAIAGQALKRITLTKINDFSFSFPCLAEQTKIAKFLSTIDQKIDVVVQQIEQVKQWKKGLLQQMFV